MYSHTLLFSLLTSLTTVCSHNLLASNATISESLTLDNFENFYPSSITQGKLNDTNLDLDISNNNHFYINGQYSQLSTTGGGGITVNNLNITNNPGPIVFQANQTTGNGGAIYCQNNCTISNNKQVCCFIENMAGASKNAGAIQAATLNISHNQGPIQFLNNTAENQGGAITTTSDLMISENYGEITFRNNRCLSGVGVGGSIYVNQTATITQNHAPITFANNQGGSRGCIYADTLIISDNNGVIKFTGNYSFSNNRGSGGGAIYCAANCNITNNREKIIFANNCSLQNAGGIYTKNLTIRDNGPILFLNNSSYWGGAVQNIQGTEQVKAMFYLSADYGDIIFNGNLNTGTNKYYRNALHSTPHLNLQIGARSGYRVAFYDPIENSHPSSSTLIFNPESYHLGTVLFSGATIPNASQQEADYTSYLRNTTNIAHGTLAVEDGACLAIYSLTQDEGFLRLGSQSIIVTAKQAGDHGTTANCNLAITKLALNLPSLLKENAQAPKIWIYPNQSNNSYSEDSNPTITISGDLTLVNDNNESPYESLDLANSITKVPFLYLCDNANKKIDVSNLNIEAINNMQHYGYQGIWSPYWEEYSTAGGTTLNTANTSHRMLYADWTATQYYIPNPKFQAPLVANSLWGNLYTIKNNTPTHQIFDDEENHFSILSYGSGTNIHQRTRNHIHGFHMLSGGYAVNPSSTTISKQKLAFIFAQQFTHIKEKVSHNKIIAKNYLAGMQIQLPWLHQKFITTGYLAYNYGDHKLSSKYVNDNKTSQGIFYTHSFLASFDSTLIFFSRKHYDLATFLEAFVFTSTLSQFEETGDHPRTFATQSPLRAFALPIGILIQTKQNSFITPTLWKFSLTYQPLVYKQSPKILTTLIASNGSWISQGSPVSRHTYSIKIDNETQILHNIKMLFNYQGDVSSSTFSNYLHIGSRITF